MVPLGRCSGTLFGTQGILYSRPTHARVSETDRRQVSSVLAGWHLQHASGRRRAQPPPTPWAYKEPRATRSLQRRGVSPGERQQLPVEHSVDLQRPGSTRRQAGGHVHRAQGLLNIAVGSALLWLAAHGLRVYTDLSPWVGGNAAKAVSTVSASTVSFLFLRLFDFRPKQA